VQRKARATQRVAGKVVLTALAVSCTAFFVLSRTFYDEALIDAFFAFAVASIVILHLRVSPKLLDAVLVAGGTGLMGFICFGWLRYPHAVVPWLSFAGLSSFLILALRFIWSHDERKLLGYAWIPALLFVASEYFASTMLDWTTAAHPKTLDIYMLMFDASLRFQPAFVAGRLYALHPFLHNASLLAYIALAVPITIVYGGRLVRNLDQAFPAMLAFLITGPLGILFYNLFPVSGPRYLFGIQFPFSAASYAALAHVILEPVQIGGARNGVPSLHLAWTLLAWWYSRGLSRIERTISFVFLSLTVFATLGTGEHWLGDLVVAFPFALMISAVCSYRLPINDARRWTAFLFGLSATLTWMILLRYCTRFFWTSPLVPWSLIVGTIALTCIRQRILTSATVDAVALGTHPNAASSRTTPCERFVESVNPAWGKSV
jgi:hypothetical protein